MDMEINNSSGRKCSLTVTIASDQRTIIEETRVIPSGSSTSMDTGISEPGTYEVQIEAGESQDTSIFSIEKYDLENELAIIVKVRSQDIFAVLQE